MTINSEFLVSIVVTTKNEEKHIENCLLSISEQSYPHIEIIVVDNYSTDKTKEIARKFTSLVFDKGPERSAQRNYGMIDIAKGKYVMFVDADMILSQNLITNCVLAMEKGSIVALHIPEIVLGQKYWSKVRRFERLFYDGTVIDGARFFKKNIFEKTGGFDEALNGPEDWDIDKKVKYYGNIQLLCKKLKRIKYSDWLLLRYVEDRGKRYSLYENVIFHNESEFIMSTYISKKNYYSKSFEKYIAKWGHKDKDIKRQFGLWYRFIGIFVENGKWKRLLRNFHLSFGMYALRLIVGFNFLFRKC